MNGSAYLKFILTLLTLSVIIFGYLGVSSLDRLHRVNVRLLEKIENGNFAVQKNAVSVPEEKKTEIPSNFQTKLIHARKTEVRENTM